MKNFRNDAEQSYFLENELESISERIYDEYPTPAYASIVPVDTSDPEGAEEVGYTMYKRTGMSQILSAGDADSPSVDAYGSKFKIPVFDLGNHFKYTNKEVRNAKFAGAPLESDKVFASKQSVEMHHDDICMLGDGAKGRRFGGMYGIVFHPNVTKMIAPKKFVDMTADEILAEFARIKKQIIVDTKQIFTPNTWAMSTDLQALFQGIMVSGTAVSVWERLKATYSDMTFVTHYVLKDVGKNPTTEAVEATEALICYYKHPRVMVYKMPISWRTLPAINTGREMRTETESSSAGVMLKQPTAVVVYHSF